MKLAVFEGSPDEIKAIWDSMNATNATVVPSASPVPEVAEGEAEDSGDDGEETATLEFCRAVINRRHLPDSQRKVLLALYTAYPDKMTAGEIADELDYEPSQMAGFWGAFYRRISYTPDRKGDILEWVEPEDGHLYDCRLTENMKQAIELEGLV